MQCFEARPVPGGGDGAAGVAALLLLAELPPCQHRHCRAGRHLLAPRCSHQHRPIPVRPEDYGRSAVQDRPCLPPICPPSGPPLAVAARQGPPSRPPTRRCRRCWSPSAGSAWSCRPTWRTRSRCSSTATPCGSPRASPCSRPARSPVSTSRASSSSSSARRRPTLPRASIVPEPLPVVKLLRAIRKGWIKFDKPKDEPN